MPLVPGGASADNMPQIRNGNVLVVETVDCPTAAVENCVVEFGVPATKLMLLPTLVEAIAVLSDWAINSESGSSLIRTDTSPLAPEPAQ